MRPASLQGGDNGDGVRTYLRGGFRDVVSRRLSNISRYVSEAVESKVIKGGLHTPSCALTPPKDTPALHRDALLSGAFRVADSNPEYLAGALGIHRGGTIR